MMKLETLRKWYLINGNSFLSYSFFCFYFIGFFCAKINVKKIGENWQVYRAHVFIPYTIKKMEGFCGLSMARCKNSLNFNTMLIISVNLHDLEFKEVKKKS